MVLRKTGNKNEQHMNEALCEADKETRFSVYSTPLHFADDVSV
jgi:hypothetical protein